LLRIAEPLTLPGPGGSFLRVHLGGFSAPNPAVAAEQNGGVRSGKTSRYASGGRSKQVGDSTRYGIRSTHAAQ